MYIYNLHELLYFLSQKEKYKLILIMLNRKLPECFGQNRKCLMHLYLQSKAKYYSLFSLKNLQYLGNSYARANILFIV